MTITNPLLSCSDLLSHVKDNWEHLARTAPYWSTLTDDAYLQGPNEEFWESGKHGADDIASDIVAAGMDPSQMSALELGSGVGRLLKPMSKLFKSVTGYDISPTMIELCEHDNCHVYSGKLPRNSHDLVFSSITLQHNPPLVIERLLEDMFLASRNAVWFQLPLPPAIPSSLNPPIPCIPMYGLTESKVKEIGSEMGFEIASCHDNDYGGQCPSKQYTFIKNEGTGSFMLTQNDQPL
jgi:hypothetical protein